MIPIRPIHATRVLAESQDEYKRLAIRDDVIDGVMIDRDVIERIIGRDRIVDLEGRASGAILLGKLERDTT